MYLHLGRDTVIPLKNVVGIFDLDNTTVSQETHAYLASAQKGMRVVNVCEDIPKSFVVCVEKGKETVYISQISAATLKKRADNILFSEEL